MSQKPVLSNNRQSIPRRMLSLIHILLLANAEDNVERAIQSASAVLEAVQEFVPEATLFYHVTHAADSLKNYLDVYKRQPES